MWVRPADWWSPRPYAATGRRLAASPPWYEVDAFCRRTCPWHLLTGADALVSYDEHTLPRWTRKFHIPKGYITTRNKYMRCEKLFYSYEVQQNRYLAVRATPGDCELRQLAVPSIEQVLRYGQPARCTPCSTPGRASPTPTSAPCGTWPRSTQLDGDPAWLSLSPPRPPVETTAQRPVCVL